MVAKDHGRGDLIAGIAAAMLFGLASLIGLPLWLGIPLAVATYGAVVLVGRETERGIESDDRRGEIAYAAAVANAAAIRGLLPRIIQPAVREQVGRIASKSSRVLAVMREDRSVAAAPMFNDRLLQPFHALLTDYIRLTTRDVKSAAESIARAESHDLPMFERAVDDFYEKLHRTHVVDLATLAEMLELNLESLETTTLRRSPS